MVDYYLEHLIIILIRALGEVWSKDSHCTKIVAWEGGSYSEALQRYVLFQNSICCFKRSLENEDDSTVYVRIPFGKLGFRLRMSILMRGRCFFFFCSFLEHWICLRARITEGKIGALSLPSFSFLLFCQEMGERERKELLRRKEPE